MVKNLRLRIARTSIIDSAVSLEIRALTQDEFSLWDTFVDESPKGTLFHKTFWLQASGREFVVYGLFKGQELSAGIPLVHSRRAGVRSASHPVLTPYLGVLFKEQDSKYVSRISQEKEMSREIARMLKGAFGSVTFNFTPGPTDLQPFIWEGFSPGVRYTYILDLTNSLDDIWRAMEDSRRRSIKRAQRDNVSVVTSDDFELTFSLVEKTFVRQGKQAHFRSAAFGYNQALKARNQCKSFLARDENGNYIAVVYIVWDSRGSYYLLGGYDSERRHHGASALAMWEAIRFTRDELSLGEFDFEGSMIPQVEQFFRKFGAVQTPYYRVSWVRPHLKGAILAKRAVGTVFRSLGLQR